MVLTHPDAADDVPTIRIRQQKGLFPVLEFDGVSSKYFVQSVRIDVDAGTLLPTMVMHVLPETFDVMVDEFTLRLVDDTGLKTKEPRHAQGLVPAKLQVRHVDEWSGNDGVVLWLSSKYPEQTYIGESFDSGWSVDFDYWMPVPVVPRR